MEQAVKVIRARRILKDSKGNAINIVLLDLANGKPSIIRNASQFVQDAKNSFLDVPDSCNSIQHPAMNAVLRGMFGATIIGDITYNKKGEQWVVTEDSRVITDKTHPQYGKVTVGMTQPYKEDNTRVEGFLNLIPNIDQVTANANAYAQAQLTAMNIFDALAPSAPVELAEVEVAPSILDEIAGNIATDIESEEVTE